MHILTTNNPLNLLNPFQSVVQTKECPKAGGKSVFIARNIYRLINDSIIYNDASACDTSGMRKSAAISNSTFEFTLYPNPANEGLTVQIKLPEGDVYEFSLIDQNGRTCQRILNKTDRRFYVQTRSLSSGLYSLKLTNSKGITTNKRVSIVH